MYEDISCTLDVAIRLTQQTGQQDEYTLICSMSISKHRVMHNITMH